MKKIVLSILLTVIIVIGSIATSPVIDANAACLHTQKQHIGNTDSRTYTYTLTTCYIYNLYRIDKCLLCGQIFYTLQDSVIFSHNKQEELIRWDANWYYFRQYCTTCGFVFQYYQIAKDPGDEPW